MARVRARMVEEETREEQAAPLEPGLMRDDGSDDGSDDGGDGDGGGPGMDQMPYTVLDDGKDLLANKKDVEEANALVMKLRRRCLVLRVFVCVIIAIGIARAMPFPALPLRPVLFNFFRTTWAILDEWKRRRREQTRRKMIQKIKPLRFDFFNERLFVELPLHRTPFALYEGLSSLLCRIAHHFHQLFRIL